jgi:hypothetical protein
MDKYELSPKFIRYLTRDDLSLRCFLECQRESIDIPFHIDVKRMFAKKITQCFDDYRRYKCEEEMLRVIVMNSDIFTWEDPELDNIIINRSNYGAHISRALPNITWEIVSIPDIVILKYNLKELY